MICIPQVSTIIDDRKTAEKQVESNLRRLSVQFIDCDMYPEFAMLRAFRKIIKKTLSKQERIELVYAGTGDIKQAITTSGITALFGKAAINHIEDFYDLMHVISFLVWLDEKFDAVSSIGNYKLTDRVWKGIRFAARGGYLHLTKGTLALSYKDEKGDSQNQFYFYRQVTNSNGFIMYRYAKYSHLDISVAAPWSQVIPVNSPKTTTVSSITGIKSTISAPFDRIIQPTATHYLSVKLLKLVSLKK